ncbi:hypothetical protein [Arthrobacter sp. 754]|uniref:hypothetical protein n=1 Tax=Arthrobacter sp. 754 TaxID=3156315 RepID=UPI0033963A51
MSDWTYKIPTLDEAPKRLFDWDSPIRTDGSPELRLGVFCEESSHEGEPWFIASFVPNYPWMESTGELVWAVSPDYPTGSGHALRVAGAHQQLLVEDKPVSVDGAGIPITNHSAHQASRSRWPLECKACGLRYTYKSESLQPVIAVLLRAGWREISLSGLESARKHTKN